MNTTVKTRKKLTKSNVIFIIITIVLLGLIAFCCAYAINDITVQLFKERAANSDRIISKVGKNIETVMNDYWDTADNSTTLLQKMEFTQLDEAMDFVEKMDDSLTRDVIIMLIDDEGKCHTSAHVSAIEVNYPNKSELPTQTGEHKVYVSDFKALGKSVEQMLFTVKLNQTISLSAPQRTVNIEYLCIMVQMDALDAYLDTERDSVDSMVFITDTHGNTVYKPSRQNKFSDITNILVQLKTWSYNFDTSADGVLADINSRKGGCAHFSYSGERFFLGYLPLEINDWSAVFIMPEAEVSANSQQFMRVIVISISLVAIVVLLAFVVITLFQTGNYRKKQKAAQRQLVLAAEAEHAANEAKTRFLSSMSHDIRTPMNAIIGMTNIAAKHLDDTNTVRDCLGKITLAGNHLLTLINDILDISKIESGRMVLTPVNFSLATLTSNLVNIVQPQIKSKRQNFDVHVHNITHEYLYADELRLSQVFVNLLTNAVKYTPEGGKITLDLKEETTDKPNTVRLIFTVSDTGIGMSEEYMKTMYETFSRATDSRVDKIQGSGLGLAICKQMTKLMGGEIECQSEINKGTTFTVTIDLRIAETQGEYALPPIDVLLCDDDEIFLDTAAETLREMGANVTSATGGKQAITLAEQHKKDGKNYTVIIVDVRMPDMSGIETTRELRKKLGKDVPIILVSAYDRSDVEDDAKAAGANGFICKPFFGSTVFEEITKNLNITAEREEVNGEDASAISGMNVLVAEDNDLNWEIIAEILDEYGITATRAETGKDAVDIISAAADGEYDLILMDVQMPVMNGREATRLIRKSDREYVRTIPIIAMTADAFAEDIAACLESGMNGHIAKPIDIKRLYNELYAIKQSKKQ